MQQIRRILLFILAAAALALGQQTSGTIPSTAGSSCVPVGVFNQSTAGIQITGSWTGTLQPKISIQGQTAQNIQVVPSTSSTAQSTITANGLYTARVAGGSTFYICGNTVSSGTANVFLNATTAVSLNGLGGGGAGATGFDTITSGTNITAAMIVGNGASLTPNSAQGQINAVGDWFDDAPGTLVPNTPTASVSNTGGSLAQGTWFIRLTYVGLGTIAPSGELRQQLNATNCASNSTCQITVNMPTSCTAGNLPTGASGCTVWDINTSSNAEKQQAAGNACVNITTATCVINSTAVGSLLSAIVPATTGVVPSPLTSIAQPDFIIPTSFMQIGDGSYVPVAGIDFSGLNVLTQNTSSGFTLPAIGGQPGTFTWTHRFFINDTNAPPLISNAQVSIHHQMCQTTGCLTTANAAGVDDRALVIEMVDAGVASPFVEQKLTQYNENLLQNNSFTCNPIGGGVPWGESCAAAGRFVSADQRTVAGGNGASQQVGVAGVVSNSANVTPATGMSPSYAGVVGGAFQTGTNPAGSSAVWAGGFFGVNAAAGNTASQGYGILIQGPTVKFSLANVAEFIGSAWNTTGAADYAIRSDSVSKTNFGGAGYFASLGQNATTLPVAASIVENGSLSTNALGTPTISGVAVAGTPGSTTISYKAVCKDANGYPSAASSVGQTTTANATLTGANFTTIQFSALSTVPQGCASVDIYRTATNGTSPTTTGKIGNVVLNTNFIVNGLSINFNDTGLAPTVSSATPPTTDGTGSLSTASISQSGGTQRVTGSNFTTSSASLVPLFTWHLAAGKSYSFHCGMTYQQATAAAGITLGVQAGANTVAAPQNVSATAVIYTNTTGAASTFTTGTLATLATTTATNVLVGGTPAATGTNYYATMDGGLTMNATDPGDFVVMVATNNAADQISLLKDSTFCDLR